MNSDTLRLVLYGLAALAVIFFYYQISRLAPSPAQRKQKRWLKVFGISLFLLWLVTGLFVLFEQLFPDKSSAKALAPLTTTVFLLHLFFWMLLGMIANYLWDHFRAKKDWDDINPMDLLPPFLISPIVFYSVWGFASGQRVAFVLALIAFQNGFFWQVIFAKAGPIISGGGSKSDGANSPTPAGPQRN